MKSISIPQERPLDQVLIRILERLDQSCQPLGIPYLLTGAMAREILLVHGYGLPPGRATRDVDFGFQVADWAAFPSLAPALGPAPHPQTARGAGLPAAPVPGGMPLGPYSGVIARLGSSSLPISPR